MRFVEIESEGAWRGEFRWLDPAAIPVGEGDLHWRKVTPDVIRESFNALERFSPFLEGAELGTEIEARQWRDRLAAFRDETGQPLFAEKDLRYFDLYFGGDSIRIERYAGRYNIINGRHRLWLAQQEGVRRLPVFVVERVIGNEVTDMSAMELGDIERESVEQHEKAHNMFEEAEAHRERVKRLEAVYEELKSSQAQVRSEAGEIALKETVRAREETENRLEQLRVERDRELQENEKRGAALQKAFEGRLRLYYGMMAMRNEAKGEIAGHVHAVMDALMQDLQKMDEVRVILREAREKLERLQI